MAPALAIVAKILGTVLASKSSGGQLLGSALSSIANSAKTQAQNTPQPVSNQM